MASAVELPDTDSEDVENWLLLDAMSVEEVGATVDRLDEGDDAVELPDTDSEDVEDWLLLDAMSVEEADATVDKLEEGDDGVVKEDSDMLLRVLEGVSTEELKDVGD